MPPDRPRPKAAKVTGDKFVAVIRAYLDSKKFESLAPKTQKNYQHLLTIAERPNILGGLSTEEIRPALVQAFLDGFADRPGAQQNAKVALKSLERWAIVRDLLPRPITTGTEAPGTGDGHKPWPDELVELAEREARPHIARIITLAANTGQRGSDIIRMRWSDLEDFEGRPGIHVNQQKTRLALWVPLTQELEAAMATWERRPTFLALKADGQPFAHNQLSIQWGRERAGNPALRPIAEAGLRLHGLRATAVVRLRRAGATTGQIADMVGMSEAMVKRYSRFSEQRLNALAAVHILDTSRNTLRTRDSGIVRKATKPTS